MTTRKRMARWGAPAAAILAVGTVATFPALTGCGVDTAGAAEASLERFTSCAALTDYARTRALELVGPYGLTGGTGTVLPEALAAADSATRSAAPNASTSAAPTAAPDHSATNIQEAGIDEPDIVKTDGTRIFAVVNNRLYGIDASGPAPRILGSVTVAKDMLIRDMLLTGDTLVLMADAPVAVRPGAAARSTSGREPAGGIAEIAPAAQGAALTQIDVSDPTAMRTVRTLRTEARYVTARLTGTTARIVMVAGAPTGVTFTYPTEPGSAGERAALLANRRALSRTTADDWLPRYTVTAAGATTAPRPLVPCDAVSRPSAFSGLDILSVLTVDLGKGIDPVDSDAVMASGENVYASPTALYVATNRWATLDAAADPAGVNTTQIHAFTADGDRTAYRASGAVTGHLLNQFSMSEHEGVLRVATTDATQTLVGGDAVVTPDGGPASESHVTTLRADGGRLRQIGRVGGLGRGERIYAVRFVGPTGYVVTFRQTDPLYTVDLSDPAAPRVAGELKIAGYSAYLHPIGDGLLIGVGQDADDEGRTKGLQVSLFDVSDPANPRRLRNGVLPGANSEAEWDHHAFLWWPATSLAVVPYQRFPTVAVADGSPADVAVTPGGEETGALGMVVTRDGIREAGRITHPRGVPYAGQIRRSLVVGNTLFTLSDTGIAASSVDDLARRAWLPFT